MLSPFKKVDLGVASDASLVLDKVYVNTFGCQILGMVSLRALGWERTPNPSSTCTLTRCNISPSLRGKPNPCAIKKYVKPRTHVTPQGKDHFQRWTHVRMSSIIRLTAESNLKFLFVSIFDAFNRHAQGEADPPGRLKMIFRTKKGATNGLSCRGRPRPFLRT